jgi:hypothetical protein
MNNALALPRLRLRRWKPPSREVIYHLLVCVAGLMFIASSTIRLIRGQGAGWSLLGLVCWSLIYMNHRYKARDAQLGPVKPISRLEWVWLACAFMLAVPSLYSALV